MPLAALGSIFRDEFTTARVVCVRIFPGELARWSAQVKRAVPSQSNVKDAVWFGTLATAFITLISCALWLLWAICRDSATSRTVRGALATVTRTLATSFKIALQKSRAECEACEACEAARHASHPHNDCCSYHGNLAHPAEMWRST